MQHAETALANRIRVALSKYGVVFRQNSGVFTDAAGNRIRIGVVGMSDLLYIGAPVISGQPTVAWLEVKTATGKPSEEQIKFISAMQRIGCKAGIVRSVADALAIAGIPHREEGKQS